MKIAFLALSGVRVCDQKLLEMGLTLPGFVERSRTIASLPSLGLLTIAALTPEPNRGSYIECPGDFKMELLPNDIDAVAISALSARIGEAYTIADRIRTNGIKVILGGLHVTALPEEAAKHADAIVIGEGEPLWSHLVNDLASDRLQPRYDARSIEYSLADAPIPSYELLCPSNYNRLTIQTTRGCPWRCDFCAASPLLTPKYKLKPIPNVLAELAAIKHIWPDPFIELADDNTFASKHHGVQLARALMKENVRWFTESDISLADSPELLELLRDSGCVQVLIGLESACPQGLSGLETKKDWKAKQFARYQQAIQTIQSSGISVNGCFVMGLDGTGSEHFDDVLNFVKQSGLHEVQVTVLTPFPGTPLYSRLLSQGRILRPGAWETCTLFDWNFQPEKMDVSQMRELFYRLVSTLYSEEETRHRRARFRQTLRDRLV